MQPKLRDIRTQPAFDRGQQGFILDDPLGISKKALFVSIHLSLLLGLIDGTRDIRTLVTEYKLYTGRAMGNSNMELLISQLDEALFLENDRFLIAYQSALNRYRASPAREPILAGSCYPKDSSTLKSYLQKHLDQVSGDSNEEADGVVGFISPHIDYQRGANVYARVWSKAKTALEQAELIVILGTDHIDSKGMVTLTHQNYETPLGVVPAAKEIVEEFADKLGDDAFASELNHCAEHSIESSLIWLQYLLGKKTCPVVPILCGTFYKFIEKGESPLKANHILSTINILNKLCQDKRTIIVAAADLAHMGPVFGDQTPMDAAGRVKMAKDDEEIIQILCRGDAGDFFSVIQKEKDRRRVCGAPPIYITLSSMPDIQGTSHGYAQCPASPDLTSLVSICGVLYRGKNHQPKQK